MENFEKYINDYFNLTINTLNNINREAIVKFIHVILETYKNDGTIYTFGNGGSGATASHLCEDFIKGVSEGLEKKFKVICLNDHAFTMMAIANDDSYENIFIEQLKNFLKKGDLVVGISGSGNSMNVVKALEYSKNIGAKTVVLCGFDGGKSKNIADLVIHAKINNMEVSEDVHLVVVHCLKSIVKNYINSKKKINGSLS